MNKIFVYSIKLVTARRIQEHRFNVILRSSDNIFLKVERVPTQNFYSHKAMKNLWDDTVNNINGYKYSFVKPNPQYCDTILSTSMGE